MHNKIQLFLFLFMVLRSGNGQKRLACELVCPSGFHCFLRDGKEGCNLDNVCDIFCRPRFECKRIGGKVGCVRERACPRVNCIPGFHCSIRDHLAHCVPNRGAK